MDKKQYLTLESFGNMVYQAVIRYLQNSGKKPNPDISLKTEVLQAEVILTVQGSPELVIKMYPHRNYAAKPVFRLEVLKIAEGDNRGNRVAFAEAADDTTEQEIRSYVENFLKQAGR